MAACWIRIFAGMIAPGVYNRGAALWRIGPMEITPGPGTAFTGHSAGIADQLLHVLCQFKLRDFSQTRGEHGKN